MFRERELGAIRTDQAPQEVRRPEKRLAQKPAERWQSCITFAVALLAVLIRLYFWHYTHRSWEDALITVQHAENAARGLGLTHVPGGPRIHGFTSPLSVLIPLLGELVHPGLGLPLLKLVSAICGGITVWLAMRISQRLGLAFPVTLLIGGYLAIEHQQILFGMAGMETQVAVTVLLLSIYSLFELKPLLVGTSLALCLLARPDFGFWVVIVIALLGWRCRRQRDFQSLETIGLALLLIYGPWLAFTTWYYGGPLPNTILAKATGYGNPWDYASSVANFVTMLLVRTRIVFKALGPAYAGNGANVESFGFDPYALICLVVLLFALAGSVVSVRRKNLPSLAICTFVVAYAIYYVFLVHAAFPWYSVPLTAVTILAAGIGLDSTVKVCFPERWRSIAGYALAAAYLASFAVVVPATFRGERNVQSFVEDEGRKQVGLYLASVMRPGQTVGSESLGYVGYYSRHTVFDYPGLCNRQVVLYLREHPKKRNLQDMLDYFHPDYIVIRPVEYGAALEKGYSWLLNDYQRVASFRVPQEKRAQLLFARDNVDLEFYVLRLKASIPASALALTR